MGSARQQYVQAMEYQEVAGDTKWLPKYDKDWRDKLETKFDVSTGKKIIHESTLTLKQGLRDLKLFKGVKEVWIEFRCPSCGEIEYVTWDLCNIDNDKMFETCPHCTSQYVLNLKNTRITKWVK